MATCIKLSILQFSALETFLRISFPDKYFFYSLTELKILIFHTYFLDLGEVRYMTSAAFIGIQNFCIFVNNSDFYSFQISILVLYTFHKRIFCEVCRYIFEMMSVANTLCICIQAIF